MINRMNHYGEKEVRNYQQYILEIKRILSILNNPKNKGKLAGLTSTENICTGTTASLKRQLQELGLTPNFAQVRSRGSSAQVPGLHLSYNFIGATATVVKGITLGISLVAGPYHVGWFWSVGEEWGLGLGLGISISVFPKVPFNSFEGDGKSVRLSALLEVTAEFDENWKWQGFTVGAGAKAEGGYATTNTKQF